MATLCNLQELLLCIPPEWQRYREEKPCRDHGSSPCDAEGSDSCASGRQVRCARKMVNGWWPGGPDASSRGRARACHMCPHGTAVKRHKHTRFSSRDARRNLIQAAKSGVRLLFLRSKDRRASKTPALSVLRQRRRMQTARNPSSLPSGAPIWESQCSCSVHPAYVDFHHPLGRLSNRANTCIASCPAIETINNSVLGG